MPTNSLFGGQNAKVMDTSGAPHSVAGRTRPLKQVQEALDVVEICPKRGFLEICLLPLRCSEQRLRCTLVQCLPVGRFLLLQGAAWPEFFGMEDTV